MPTAEYYDCPRAMCFRNSIHPLLGKVQAKLPVAVGLEAPERLKCVVTSNLVPFKLIDPPPPYRINTIAAPLPHHLEACVLVFST